MIEALRALNPFEAEGLFAEMRELALKKGFTYERGGVVEPINLIPMPAFFTGEQVRYAGGAALAIKRGVDAVYRAWFADDGLKRILQFNDNELSIIGALRPVLISGDEPVWYRLDCHFHMDEPDWRERITVFEINSCAVGGVHYSPAADEIFAEAVAPIIRRGLKGGLLLMPNPDPRSMLLGVIERQARSLGRKGLTIAYVEDTTAEEGITEGRYIVERWRKGGIDAVLCDPRELYLKNGEIRFRDTVIDMVYRNLELSEIIEMDSSGDDVTAMKAAFREGRVVSSLCGDFDHKSMWEALGGGGFDKYLDPSDIEIYRKSLPWTRVLREAKARGPDGLEVDLPVFASVEKDRLVLKPNRLCGGYGVAIGRDLSSGEWDGLVDSALKEEGGWVLQSYAEPEQALFPVFSGGRLSFEEHNIVYGLTSTVDGTAILARVSRSGVVNVARQGGLMTVFRLKETGS